MVGIAVLAAFDQAQAANSTRELLNDCQNLERGKRGAGRLINIPKATEALVCWGYLKAMQDLSIWVDEKGNKIFGSCPPESTTTLDLVHSFVRYGLSHRGQLPDNAALAVTKAFQQAFPCDEAGAPSG